MRVSIVNTITRPDLTAGLGTTVLGERNTVMVRNAGILPYVHEWGHQCGLGHRGTGSNPGAVQDALMGYPASVIGPKVNRRERDVICGAVGAWSSGQ